MSSLSISKAWDEAKAALLANRKLIVPVALGLILLPAVIVSMVEPRVAPGEPPPAGSWMLIGLAMVIVMIVGQLAIVLLVNGWRGSVGEAIGKASRRSPIFILAALAYLVPVILIFSVLLGFAGIGTTADGQVDLATFNSTGWLVLMLFFLVLVFVSIRLLPMLPVVASEATGALGSLKRSYTMTAGHFWRLFGFMILLMVAFFILALTVGSVIGSLVTITLGEPSPWSLSLLLIALAGGLVQAGFVMVYAAMVARIYAQLAAPQAGVPDVTRES
ncbi:glycerophosphoryl diester phosphodiesterase membrane domain-containing protein [Sphingomonas sp. NSE70-1]|uniref:Glycerophosphoryl diester phosphodiesterase membrane domain-containing protein n=1 Tax=Sphingomonas caseinilyticus TaxID=2908205 RepID=A0ABT0RSD0_9SPHN|nr:glycerophosphoryl diester phosphodiesterase membrane domain-containing protein [Sphingomonas caseinilyticus]MCL6697918.1 glycerophosphoryl diester phosphodiesterase membrane domain-containing protein [Sphingomonas caseinilyticus]